MIIACPDCSGPYQLPDDQIAPLVQVECPHCTYRIILDFAAANDASLIEDGMKMASGYASEADYRSAAAGAPAARPVAAPAPAPEPEPEPAPEPPAAAPVPTPAPKPTPVAKPTPAAAPATRPPSGPVRSPVPSGARTPQATTGESAASSDTGRTILGQPPISIPPAPPEARAKTPAPLELTDKVKAQKAAAEAAAAAGDVIELTERAEEIEAEVEEVEAEVEEAEAEEFEEVEAEVGDAEDEEAAEARRPPHTPPAKAASTPPPAADEDIEVPEGPTPAELSAAGMASPDVEPEPGSRALLYLLIGLLLIGGALVGFSFYETGDPNPMPLIEELIQSYTD